ncbi:MAG: hypothetical protein FWE02_06555 [Defluviitaleaceae bacterium]|nr:hypothetical protein [Defluviitaleaceae bacterium]
MLLKLLKYDFLYSKNAFLGMGIMFLIFAVVFGLYQNPDQFGFGQIGVMVFFGIVFGASTFGSIVFAVIIVANNFHRNLLSEHGYLMLTLPVRKEFLLLSKVLISIFWYNFMILVAVGFFFIVALVSGELANIQDWAEFLTNVLSINWIQIYLDINLPAFSGIALLFFILTLARTKLVIKFNAFIAWVIGFVMFIVSIWIANSISEAFGAAGVRIWFISMAVGLYITIIYLLKNKLELE